MEIEIPDIGQGGTVEPAAPEEPDAVVALIGDQLRVVAVARSAGLVEDELMPGLLVEVEPPEVAEVVLRREGTGPFTASLVYPP